MLLMRMSAFSIYVFTFRVAQQCSTYVYALVAAHITYHVQSNLQTGVRCTHEIRGFIIHYDKEKIADSCDFNTFHV